jgi:hypothetical protein
MSPQRCAVLAVLCGTLVLNGWVAAELARLGAPGTETGRAPITVDTRQATVSDTGIAGAALSDPRQVPPPVPTASASAPDPMPAEPLFEVVWTARVTAVLPDQRQIPPTASASTPEPVQDSVAAVVPPVEVAGTGNVDAALPDPGRVSPPDTPSVPTASASMPDPVQDTVAAAAPPVEVVGTGNVGAAVPDPDQAPPPVSTPSASTPDPVPDGVAAAALPVEVAETANVGAAVPDPGQVPPPVPTASANTPDPVPGDVAAAAPRVELAEPASVGGALPDHAQMPPPATPPERTASASTPDPVQDDVAAAAPPVEVAELASIGGALPDDAEMLPPATPPVRMVSASTPDPVQDDVTAAAPPVEVFKLASVDAASPDSREMLPPATPPVRLVSLFRSDPVEDLKPAVRPVETLNECLVAEICIDEYLWSFYERTPKVDTNKVTARIKTTVKRKGKTRTVIKSFTKYVAADFTWKDPIAAQRAGMSVKDYVIGGMDRGFKLKLYRALRAMDDAGLMPGITSAFRDDYRQSIASGNKAASDSSYHGGSRRGGYGHGLAADLVSVKGETRVQRWVSTVELWKWIDAREQELGIGRPYLNRDPPHVGPINGKEFADKRGGAKARRAALPTNRPVAVGDRQRMVTRAAKARSLRVGSI